MTNHWVDIRNADIVLIMGGNAAEAHPCGFKWVTEAKAHNKAKLVVVDPRFTRSAAVSDYYAPIRPGTDIAFLLGVMRYILAENKYHADYVKIHTNAPFIVREGFKFEDGLFSGFDEAKRAYNMEDWEYELDEQGFAKVDETMQNPRCVINLLKTHVERYTPEMVERICGTPKAKFMKVAEMIASTGNGERSMTSMYALGWTQHTHGAQNIRCMAMLQLLLGNMGVPGGGVNALRGHANVQGITDLALLTHLLPGYLAAPNEKEPDFAAYMAKRGYQPLRPDQTSYWQNYKKFFVSQLKAWWGDAAQPTNDFAFEYLPKYDVPYDTLKIVQQMYEGKMNGCITSGQNILWGVPHKDKTLAGLAKLKWLVVADPLDVETASFWKSFGELNHADTSAIQTEVFQLPATTIAEDEGSFTNSGRTILWHGKAADAPGEAKSDIEIYAAIFRRLRDLYLADGGTFPDPITKLTWRYTNPDNPSPDELLKEINGYALEDVADPKDPTKLLAKAGQQLASFAHMTDDGKTAGGCWIYTGVYTEAGNLSMRRDNSDPSGKGVHGMWGFAWPANRRILYNRASSDANGKPWSAHKAYIQWNGSKWIGPDVPDYGVTVPPEKGVGAFIMNPEGVSRLFTRGMMKDGPFPEHYEPYESPVGNVLHEKVGPTPTARVFKDVWDSFGKAEEYPYIGTTYRLTEHFHYWSKHQHINAVLQPEQFVELPEELAKDKGIKNGDWVQVSSKRGFIKAKAVVTKRVASLTVDGKRVHVVGIPIHWGFKGAAKDGYAANTLTPFVADVNASTPEFKAFLVNVERSSAPTDIPVASVETDRRQG